MFNCAIVRFDGLLLPSGVVLGYSVDARNCCVSLLSIGNLLIFNALDTVARGKIRENLLLQR